MLLVATWFVCTEPNTPQILAAAAKWLGHRVCPALPAPPHPLSSGLPIILPVPTSQAGKDKQEGTVDSNVALLLFPSCTPRPRQTQQPASRHCPSSAISVPHCPGEAGSPGPCVQVTEVLRAAPRGHHEDEDTLAPPHTQELLAWSEACKYYYYGVGSVRRRLPPTPSVCSTHLSPCSPPEEAA